MARVLADLLVLLITRVGRLLPGRSSDQLVGRPEPPQERVVEPPNELGDTGLQSESASMRQSTLVLDRGHQPAADPVDHGALEPVTPQAGLPAVVTPSAWTGRRGRRIENWLVFGIPCVLYLVLGAILVFRYDSIFGDAQARLANAYYILYSRDQHFAAIGFVWNPLPSLTMLPLLPLKALWPALSTQAFASNITSALFMAGAAQQIYGFFRDLGLRLPVRVVLIAMFILNPMIVYYGANGMSEALFILTLVVATRYLARWLVDDSTVSLVVAAAALALGYMARNEAAFAALFAALVVVAVSFARQKGVRRERIYKALTDGFVFALPFAVCFVGWALVSWVIVGHPFEQFSSVYGTSSQLRAINAQSAVHLSEAQRTSRALNASNSMAPGLPLFVLVALILAWRRKDLRIFATLALTGGVLLFSVIAFKMGLTLGSYRYFITAVPLVVMIMGSILAGALHIPSRPGRAEVPGTAASVDGRSRLRVIGRAVIPSVAALLVIAAVAAGIPTTAQAMRNSPAASEEQLLLATIMFPHQHDPKYDAERYRYPSTVKIARALDELHLRHGSVLVDNFTPCIPYVLLNSKDLQQFIIPNDEDFQRSLADPVTFRVQYLIAPFAGSGYGALDAVNRAYPTLFNDGAGIASEVRSFKLPGCPELRLFKINGAGPA